MKELWSYLPEFCSGLNHGGTKTKTPVLVDSTVFMDTTATTVKDKLMNNY